ncbi:unnamed protein product [Sphagnum balticum]
MAASSLQTYSAHCTERPHGGLLHFHLSSQVGSGSGNLTSTLLCRRRRGMLGWVLLMPQCPPPPHLNYSQRSQKLGQILLPGKKKKKKNILAMVPNKESGRHTVGKQSQELKFDTEDLLELKFGRLLGESQETTLAKVIGRKTNPDASYVEIEKPSWRKNLETKTTTSKRPLPSSSLDQIHISRPISSSVDNTVAEQDITPLQSSMSSPSVTAKHVLTSPSVSANMVSEEVVVAPLKKAAADSLVLNSVPEVTVMSAKEEKGRESTVSPLGMQEIMPITAPPTPVLAQKPFVRRPTATTAVPDDAVSKFTPPSEADSSSSPSLGQPEIIVSQEETRRRETTFGQSLEEEEEEEEEVESQPIAPSPALTGASLTDPLNLTRQQLLQTRPMPSSPKPSMKMTSNKDSSSNKKLQEAGFVLSTQTREEEDRDWLRAEALLESSTVEEMLFFGANAGGMLVSFRSLVGFLPAWELSAQRRPPSFRTWAMDKGFTLKEPKFTETFIPDSSLSGVELPMGSRAVVGSETSKRIQESSIRVEDDNERNLLKQYREERRNALSKLIGETARVVVIGLDRGRRRLRLSEKAAEGEGQELTQKKANVMEGLNVGDVVSCTVKKVTSYGAFVEVQGVPALIHISELSWNRIVDPTTVVAVGQELEAKVCRLDRFMQRINLSLKQMQVDPLRETLESLLDSTDMELETVQEIPEVNGVIKRLEQIKGIDSVVKGRCLQGMAMAPSFQVYLSGQLSNGYKLIARSGNQVQEVLVLTSLDRESAKQAILQCTMCDD